MHMRNILVYICAVILVIACKSSERNAAEELVDRVTCGRADKFSVVINPEQKEGRDWFAYYAHDGHIVLEGNNGVSIASALGHYLKTHCGWHLTWCGSQEVLPEGQPESRVRNQRDRCREAQRRRCR